MPILDVEVVGEPDAERRPELARRLADAAGEALDSRPRGTWVRLHVLPERDYAENGGAPDGARPVFVSLLLARPPEGDALRDQLARLTAAVAAVLDRPAENVHVLVEPPAAGRIAFGGELVG